MFWVIRIRNPEGFKWFLLLLLTLQWFNCCNSQFESWGSVSTAGNFSINTYIFKIQHSLGGNPHAGLPQKKAAWYDSSSITSNILLGMAIVASMILMSVALKKCCSICNDVSNPQVSPEMNEVWGSSPGEITVNTVSSNYGMKSLKAFEELPPPKYEDCMKSLKMLQKQMEHEKIVIEDC